MYFEIQRLLIEVKMDLITIKIKITIKLYFLAVKILIKITYKKSNKKKINS